MDDKPYIKNPKAVGGKGSYKFAPTAEDEEDCAQEKAIQQWLEQQGASDEFEFKYINRKGSARYTGDKASFSLDQKIGEDTERTFENFVRGSDGRDLECGEQPDYLKPEAGDYVSGYLSALGFTEEEIPCLEKTLKLSISLDEKRSVTFRNAFKLRKQLSSYKGLCVKLPEIKLRPIRLTLRAIAYRIST